MGEERRIKRVKLLTSSHFIRDHNMKRREKKVRPGEIISPHKTLSRKIP